VASDVLSEAVNLVNELKGFNVNAVEKLDAGGLEVALVDLGVISARRVIVAVLPPRTKINIKSARRAFAAALHSAEEAGEHGSLPVTVIIYSRGGSLTKPAYLYLGFVSSKSRGEVVIVNGPPVEVADVLKYLKAYGRIIVREDKVYPSKIF
jgi:hypothetical protein